MEKWLPEEEQAELIRFRRILHAHPELSWEEKETSARVVAQLEQMGLKPTTGIAKTGIFVDIGEGKPLVVLRADMDALPIHEETDVPFRSTHPGVMHACGHDAHTACLVAVARRLQENPPTNGRVRLLFQPAEELGAGAPKMIEEGVLDDPYLVGIYGLHFWSQLPTGTVSVLPGATMGSVDKFEITVRGKGGHGAEPHKCIDTLVAAAHLVTTMQTIISRRIDPLQPAVLSVGKFEAGTAFNIIPEVATLLGTIRTMDRKTWSRMPKLLEEVVHNTVAAFGCHAEIKYHRAQLPLINHPDATTLAFSVAEAFVEKESMVEFRTLAGEDFSAYLDKTKGCFFFVGAGGDESIASTQPPHHNPRFYLDEEAFPLAVRLLEGCAKKALDQSSTANA